MVDIYDEVKFIENVIKNGLSSRWERDIRLMVRYFKNYENWDKSKTREKIKSYCENNKAFKYSRIAYFGRVNSIVDKAWKDTTPLRQIQYIDISKEVLNWFLNLEDSIDLDSTQIEEFKIKRPKIVIKNGKALNWQRVKYLFTLYIWYRIQEGYIARPNVFYLKKYSKRFKEDADLKPSFNLSNERNYLEDIGGLISVNNALGITIEFINNDVFNIPITDENRIRIYTGQPSEGDLYRCGYWLEKQKMGTFICKNCGKEFAHYTKAKQENQRKYCRECANKLKSNKSEKTWKVITCVDCGKEVEVNMNVNRTCRCEECQAIRNRELNLISVRKYKAKKENS